MYIYWTGFILSEIIVFDPFTSSTFQMITDVQLAIFANALGVTLFLLVVLYHYVSVNNKKE